ncbi:glutathionylspermidine synthase family protein [Helicobacter aurati]|uniref:Glutathionylspermidine synthase family protein n=1 Tax=Helicobacter aurati TaxID=137778 RepID=A0A3D8J2N8_9HELI|nr:glutathionylspermidine synthase family protein [Helicobacter aurati]RDU71031.1 glutathionylspermidine synthase family protein [Helicobacter aurati]
MQITKLKPFTKQDFEQIGLEWHTDPDNTEYISDELIHISEQEADGYYEACNELYDMYVEAAQYVIDNNLFYELDIPNSLVDSIVQSFNEDVHWHIYGRFDLAGGLDGQQIKLLEFNADTPTMLYETSAVQYALLRANGYDENAQFNNVYEAISQNFQRLITLSDDTSNFNEIYEGWKILFSSIRGNIEEEKTVRFLQDMANNAGLQTDFCFVDEVQLSPSDGVFFNNCNFEFWFKFIPWENIAIDEPELALIVNDIMANQKGILLNPAYTLLFQSKRILKILWDLYPNHPLLLQTSYEPLGKKQVKKHAFGREGANTSILDSQCAPINAKDGQYANHKAVYQEFYPLNSYNGSFYQANVFFSYESCGLGFRKGGEIMDNYSKFVSHIIR